jgi:3-dehydroquinate synthase
MRIIELASTSRPSRVEIGECFGGIDRRLPPGRTVVITDTNVLGLYREILPPAPVLAVPPGEASKSLETVQELFEALLDLEADRTTFILGLGGGVVCDLAGFVAATFMRGVRFGFAATTLLAQVDASVGGKNGVNFRGYKNIVGTIAQPEFVLCDPCFLQTLPPEEAANGLAEIVKHALIADASMFGFLEANAGPALALEPEAIARLIADSVRIKAAVVGGDELEAGERRKLNFGHTFGHALEKVLGLPHGEAVSVGMVLAAAISVRRGMLPRDSLGRLTALLRSLKLPCAAAAAPDRVVDALFRDKKRSGERLHLVLLEEIGRAAVVSVAMEDLVRWAGEFPDILAPAKRGDR